jgi:hypothetical protein
MDRFQDGNARRTLVWPMPHEPLSSQISGPSGSLVSKAMWTQRKPGASGGSGPTYPRSLHLNLARQEQTLHR